MSRVVLCVALSLLMSTWTAAAEGGAELPPALEWNGASRELALPPDSTDPWITPSERGGLETTPDYRETMAWIDRVVAQSPLVEKVTLGKSAEGRDVWMVIVSGDGSFSAEALRASERPVVLTQAGIHSGEIDGKDAGLMLLRDIAIRGDKRGLIDQVQWLFVPIFNVDGHERRSAFGRVNQRGPRHMGWRTNARNQNLNRDFAKADTPAMQAMIRAIGTYDPDLYVDLHVTDGIDYQYDITWGYMGRHGHSPSISRWLEEVLDPPVQKQLEKAGHIPGYLVFATDNNNPDASLFKWSSSSPRFSDGYGGARHLPTLLVENHSLKPYPQRVLGTYVLLEGLLKTAGQNASSLKKAIAEDRARREKEVVLGWTVDRESEPELIDFKGVRWRKKLSKAAGTELVDWLGEPEDKSLRRVEATMPESSVTIPEAWWVPAAWPEVIERLELHGIQVERLTSPREVELELYRLPGAQTASAPFEGHVRLELGGPPVVERRSMTYAPGSARVPGDQDLSALAALLLEPESQDSFLRWGFFNEILSRTEYIEGYVIGPMADRMLAEDEDLAARFAAALESDAELKGDPGKRLEWFYRQTPYYDDRFLLYPVGRETAKP